MIVSFFLRFRLKLLLDAARMLVSGLQSFKLFLCFVYGITLLYYVANQFTDRLATLESKPAKKHRRKNYYCFVHVYSFLASWFVSA